MKYFYLTTDNTKIYTTKEMYDSQVQYEIEREEYFNNGGTLEEFGEKMNFSDFALVHCYECPSDADIPQVYTEEF